MTVAHRITPLDKARNADGRRRMLDPVAAAQASTPNSGGQALPPLMTQWMTDYAATGEPPIYLPLHTEEVSDELDN